jgi:hypothetical protein
MLQYFARLQVALFADIAPFLLTRGFGFLVIFRLLVGLNVKRRFAYPLAVYVHMGHPPLLCIFPPVNPVTLSLLWHVSPLSACEVSCAERLPRTRATT